MENLADRDSETYEELCFMCKGGGILLMCDASDCQKAYHTKCLGMTVESIPYPWSCDVHACFICNRSSEFNCLCCTKALCRECIVSIKFVQIKKKYGLCSFCLKLALLVEQNMVADSNMDCISNFHDYWKFVKEKESLSLETLQSADARMKSGQWCISGSDLDKHDIHVKVEMLSESYSTDGGKASSVERMNKSHKEIAANDEGARVSNQLSENHDDSEKNNEFEDTLGNENGKESSGDGDDNIQTQSANLFPTVNFERKKSGAEHACGHLDSAMRPLSYNQKAVATDDYTSVDQALDLLQVMSEEIEEINPLTTLYHFSQKFLLEKPDNRENFLKAGSNEIRLASLQYNYQHLH